MKIKRRINGGTKEIVENAILLSKTPKGAWVQLMNGKKGAIHRKNRDIV